MGENLHVCGYERCGKAFDTPLRLTDLSHKPHSETYYACPYCFSKIHGVHRSEANSIDAEANNLHSGGYELSTNDETGKTSKGAAQKELSRAPAPNCPHRLGYLKTRPKDEAVPDSCFICPNILQCMA